MFEQAVRMKLRFASVQGALSVEDLWDLPLTSTRETRASLNEVAKTVSREMNVTQEEDFVNPKPAAESTLALKLDIVKRVIQVKQEENAALTMAADKKRQKEMLTEILAKKQVSDLEGKSIEEIQAMIAAL